MEECDLFVHVSELDGSGSCLALNYTLVVFLYCLIVGPTVCTAGEILSMRCENEEKTHRVLQFQ